MQALLVTIPGSDPLRRLASMSLIERNLLTLEHAGCDPIVLWCDDEDLSERLQGHLAAHDVRIASTVDELQEWLEPGEILVASASRVHDKGLGSLIQSHPARPLAVSADPGSPVVLEEPPSDEALEALLRSGPPALRERVNEIEVAEPLERFVDVEVVDDASARRAEDALWQSCRKPIDGWVSTYFNRYLSLFMSRRLMDTWVAPNHISIFCILLGFASLFLVVQGTYVSILLGALALKANSVIDGVDGELARVRWQFSPIGELLDSLGDNISNFSFFGAMVYVLFDRGEPLWASLGLVGLILWMVHLIWVFSRLAAKRRGNMMIVQSNTVKAARGFWGRVVDVLSRKILRRDGFVMLSLLFAIFAWYPAIMVMVLVGGSAVFLNVVGHYLFAQKA